MPPRIGAELLLRGGQVLIGPVVVETERGVAGNVSTYSPVLPGGTVAQDATSPGQRDGRLHKVHPLCDVRAVEPHSSSATARSSAVRSATVDAGYAAVDRLPRQKNAPDLRRRCCWQCRCW